MGFEPTELALNGFQEPHSVSTCRDAVAFSLVRSMNASARSRRVRVVHAVSMPRTLPRDCSEEGCDTDPQSLEPVGCGGGSIHPS